MFSSFSNWFGQFFTMDEEPQRIQPDHHIRATGLLRQALECDEQSSILILQIFFF
jgi:hypothetical protein